MGTTTRQATNTSHRLNDSTLTNRRRTGIGTGMNTPPILFMRIFPVKAPAECRVPGHKVIAA